MKLQIVMGVSGSGKTTYVFDRIVSEAKKDINHRCMVVVPEQFSQEATRTLVHKNGGGILNIDVLSFRRMAYRALEEMHGRTRAVLTDEGKIMLLRKVLADHKDELEYFTKGLDRPGFLDEVKSLFSELNEYAIGEEELGTLIDHFESDSRLSLKLQDLKRIYGYMRELMGESYRTADEMIPVLTECVLEDQLSFLRDSTICLDGFTGFTPVQYELIGALMTTCRELIVTVMTDVEPSDRREVFSLSRDTIRRLTELARDQHVTIEEPVITGVDSGRIAGDGVQATDLQPIRPGSWRLKDNPVIRHIEENIFSHKPERISYTPGSVQIRVCHSEIKEADFVAREAARLIRDEQAAPESIAVVTGQLDDYAPYLIRAFDRMGLSYFVDRKKSLGINPLTDYIRSFLEMTEYDYDAPSVIRFLRGGLSLFDIGETDVFENYILARGIRGRKRYAQPWEDQEEADALRERFISLCGPASEKLRDPSKKTIRCFAKILTEFISHEDNCIFCRLKELDEKEPKESKDYTNLYTAVLAVMDTMVDFLGDQTVSFREFREILMAGINSGMLGTVPSSGHRILIGDVERSRLGEVDHIFFLGNTDKRFPRSADKVGVLTDAERRRIEETGVELAPGAGQLYERELFYLYHVVTQPKKRLYLTYPLVNAEGESVRPSYLIGKIRCLFDPAASLTVEDDMEETPEAKLGTDRGRSYILSHMKEGKILPEYRNTTEEIVCEELLSYYEDVDPELVRQIRNPYPLDKRDAILSRDAAAALYGDDLKASVTRFEKFAGCPYAHFLANGLYVRERDTYEIQTPDRGNVFHNTLDRVFHRMNKEKVTWRTIGEEELKEIGASCFAETMDDYREHVFHKDKRTEYMTRHMERILIDVLLCMRDQMKISDFDQAKSELRFPEEFLDPEMTIDADGHKLRMKGRIDRIDVADGLVKIIDYKSSSREVSLGQILAGFQLQLITYLDVAMRYVKSLRSGADTPGNDADTGNRDVLPAAILYQTISESEQEWVEGMEEEGALEASTRRLLRPNGYINDSHDIYPRLDNGLNTGQVTSMAVPATTKKQGKEDPYPELSKSGTKALSTEQFEELKDVVSGHIRDYGKRMFGGEIHARPAFNQNGIDACRYCEYQGVCGKENRNHVFIRRDVVIPNAKEAIAWLDEKICKKKGGENADDEGED